ncbi:MAG: 50S ribosomal protein L13 [Methanosarcinaceae archaeon]|jgi:large subunit ribosomal protein L13|nr:50S ribosomal protein L13 [Methanosarcinaceae archaeon]NKQ39923.1 50S ribosomal protein L13 [Methanosarcinales archaeon]
MIVIDADRHIMGRLSSVVAKLLLNGETIEIVNAEKVVISGSKVKTLTDYKKTKTRGAKEFGPYFPKRSDRILKRTIRGMIPYKRARGRDALKRLKVHIGIPSIHKNVEFTQIKDASMNRLSTIKYIKLEEVSKIIGAKVYEVK